MFQNLTQNYHLSSNLFQTEQKEGKTHQDPSTVQEFKVSSQIIQQQETVFLPISENSDSGSGLGIPLSPLNNLRKKVAQITSDPMSESLARQDSLKISEPLPPGWREGTTPEGRQFYIDDVHQTTSWDRPT